MKRNLGGFEFGLVGQLEFELDSARRPAEYVHPLPSDARLNRYAAGPFCSFALPAAPSDAGVYAITVLDEIKYIGECEDLKRRFGPVGYGRIAARNCHSDGQATNCKINSRVLAAEKTGESIGVWFFRSAHRKVVEAQLIEKLAPPWNGSRPAAAIGRAPEIAAAALRTNDPFGAGLETAFASAEASGAAFVEIRAGDLHRKIGGYPGKSHRMPICCAVMKAAMLPGERVVAAHLAALAPIS